MNYSVASDLLGPLPPISMITGIKNYSPPQTMVTSNIPKLTITSENERVDFLTQQLKINESSLMLKSSSNVGKAEVYTYEHYKDGLPIINHEAKVTVMNTEILAYSHNFEGEMSILQCSTKKTEADMQEYASMRFKSTIVPGTSKLVLVDTGNDNLVQALKMQLSKDGHPTCEVAVENCKMDIVYFVEYTA